MLPPPPTPPLFPYTTLFRSFNFASIYKLPEIFVCENNGFAISTPMRKEYAIEHVAQRAVAYGFPGVTVDGRDPVTCYHVRSEEHTSELQSRRDLVCRLLLEK